MSETKQIRNISLHYYMDQGKQTMYLESIEEAAREALRMIDEDTGMPTAIEDERHNAVWSTFYGGQDAYSSLQELLPKRIDRVPTEEIPLSAPIQQHYLAFYGPDNKESGRLIWDDEGLRFEGNADESALCFLSSIHRVFPTKVEEIKRKAVEEYLRDSTKSYEITTPDKETTDL